ncbi:DnaD domain protein [Schinkia azotoformans]|uniref:Replication initiation and membrane attachment protein (DnaB) n=1 Tax=Schinkia azotoformans LMG 9581 TaxID=1131731 RepID=K6C8K0_SCHAZ|nr:DnaD domain protein [Schinkia azotoformans]EKN67465.1 replication initiation and membrane attachment protein (DnaB) [Schinkia azotoformans LMG 9581]MEC1637756.1 DnaD domain protein [Schinkia azotoformans]MEC1944991.1 DnaD domain protein [Schinkia azotoformans]
MSEHWKELLPIDDYIVRTNGILQDFDRKVLTLLYQPLIGALCYSLYMTLWSEIDVNRLWGDKNKHYHLMNLMQINLDSILNERKKLEGIGLLKTYLKDGETKTYIYELQPPLSPENFFNDGLLNIYFYNRLSKTSFNKIKHFFTDKSLNESDYKDVTSSFTDVFMSLNPSELKTSENELSNDLTVDNHNEFIIRNDAPDIFVSKDNFDFDLFFAGISDSLISLKAFNPKVREVIAKLSFIYSFNTIEMKSIVLQAIDEKDEINIEQLRKAARDFYQFSHGEALPRLVERIQPLNYRTMNLKDPQNKEEQLINQLENISPYQLLVSISGGAEPSVSDLKIIENVMFNQKLNPGVVNVLIYFVMLRSDMKLTKNYVDKVASHWARKKVKTVKEAMDLAKEEHRNYQEWAQLKRKNNSKFPSSSIENDDVNSFSSSDEIVRDDHELRKELLDWLEGKKD